MFFLMFFDITLVAPCSTLCGIKLGDGYIANKGGFESHVGDRTEAIISQHFIGLASLKIDLLTPKESPIASHPSSFRGFCCEF